MATQKKKTTSTKKPAQKRKSAPKKAARRGQRSLFARIFWLCFYFGLSVAVVGCVALWLYANKLSERYQLNDGALGGALWELPSRVYARPQELYVGKRISLKNLTTELEYLKYTKDPSISVPGTYHVTGNQLLVYKNAFGFWDKQEGEQRLRITIKKGVVTDITDLQSLETVAITRIEPLLIGSLYPKHGQDRVLISLDNTPEVLVDTLLATEDRRFYSHPGIDPKGLARALYQAIKTGKVRQGASTITQQFVKNHYLSSERKISRKVKEALISLVLEFNYSKRQILEGYLNEIFLGQDGKRAIHGFGLAAEHYFGKPLNQLGVHQIASLIALVREPSRANPFKHPEFAKRRRALILNVMAKQQLISQADADLAKSLPLDILPSSERKERNRYFSFLQLVMHRIKKEYDSESLASGLNIFSTLDPLIQDQAELSVTSMLPKLENSKRLKRGFLQAASVVVNSATAEVVAIVGDRDPQRHGFNRAYQAKRQPGSLLKPVVYMAALEYPSRYSLATMIDDSPLEYRTEGEVWRPKNYSKQNKGEVPFIDGLVHSYNIPTARIGLDIGIADVVQRLEDLGAPKGLPKYPSIVLGGVTMSPMDIAQIYESLANGGYRMPLRVINSVTDANDKPVARYPIESLKVISDGPHYLTVKAMQETVKRGTAARMRSQISPRMNIAGKTGTTDGYRDSWFAGFSGNYLNVVWVGNDDNKKTGLTGSNGALRVWMDIMKGIPLQPLNVNKPRDIIEMEIDLERGLLLGENCREHSRHAILPFIPGSEPRYYSDCSIMEFQSFDGEVPEGRPMTDQDTLNQFLYGQ